MREERGTHNEKRWRIGLVYDIISGGQYHPLDYPVLTIVPCVFCELLHSIHSSCNLFPPFNVCVICGVFIDVGGDWIAGGGERKRAGEGNVIWEANGTGSKISYRDFTFPKRLSLSLNTVYRMRIFNLFSTNEPCDVCLCAECWWSYRHFRL